jgi:hypothetical protein
MQTKQVLFARPNCYVDVAIVGAGFSGSMVAVHLAHTLRGARQIALVEKARRAGPGIAYSTENSLHLLNVPVGRMGAYPERPRHFYEWLKEHPALVARYHLAPLNEGAFVPRRLYGLYLELLVQRLALQSGGVLHSAHICVVLSLLSSRGHKNRALAPPNRKRLIPPKKLSSASKVKFRLKSLLKPRPPDGPKYFPSP